MTLTRTAAQDELSLRIAALGSRVGHARPAELAPEVEAIRQIAHRNGLDPAVTVTHFIGAALARGERGSAVRDWLGMLADAVRCDRQDVAACEAFAAACSVRLTH